jgi:uncharacterized protein YciI
MPHFYLVAYDGTDAEAPKRRQEVRAAHVERLRVAAETGAIVAGGQILDDAGKVIGSVCFADFPSRAALDAWVAEDPYTTHKVWQRVEIKPLRMVLRDRQVSA